MTSRRWLLLAVSAATLAWVQPARSADPPAQTRYQFQTIHDPNGIGKFYLGREIAIVMGHEAADWLDRPEREQEEGPSKLVEALKLKPGMVVADIGAGSGYLSFLMAPHVAPGGKVIAEDIQPEMLTIIRKRSAERKITNVQPALGTPTDPKLPPNSVDLMIMVDVYHEFSDPYEMTVNMVKALKPHGRLVFVEYRKEDPTVPIKLVHKMTEAQVKKEMAVQQLRWLATDERLPRQHIIIFEKTERPAR